MKALAPISWRSALLPMLPTKPRPRRFVDALGTPLLAAALLAALGCGASLPEPAGERLFSVLAVGDTGAELDGPSQEAVYRRVADAIAAEDAARRADALVLLGDNFYPVGLRADELVPRIRGNLADPYCRFVVPGPRWSEIADACPEQRRRGEPLPFYAVLGNHDRYTRESPRLQREAVPEFIANWELPVEEAQHYETGAGVSLILIDSMDMDSESDGRKLAAALRASRGPWRILAAHAPLVPIVDEHEYFEGHRARVASVLEATGVPVQLALAGHDHNLQILTPPAPNPPLGVIAGGGCCPRQVRTDGPAVRFAERAAGFARVDLLRREGSERLAVSLFAVPRAGGDGARRVAVWSVDLEGRVVDEGLAPHGARR